MTRGATWLLAAWLIAGCGNEVTYTSGAAGAGGGAHGAGGAQSGPGSTTVQSTSQGAGGASGICGGFAGIACGPDQFCDYPDDSCGGADGSGICRKRPSACPDLYSPTCGCDGKVHGNACDANAAGVDVAAHGNCKPPPGTFACGPTFCQISGQYCERQVSDVSNEPDGYSCKLTPPSCGKTPMCSCLGKEPCGAWCKPIALGQLMLTCPGG